MKKIITKQFIAQSPTYEYMNIYVCKYVFT